MNLSDIIRQYREDHSLTMQQFADKCGLSKGYISMLEKGRQPRNNRKIVPSIETLSKIAMAMNVTADELVSQLDGNQRIFVGKPSLSFDSLTPAEASLIEDYRQLNEDGQEAARRTLRAFTSLPEYKKLPGSVQVAEEA